jgi:preprotein translocase subunit SecE
LFVALCHNALVMTHVCFVMVFVSGVDVTFSWLVSTPVLR